MAHAEVPENARLSSTPLALGSESINGDSAVQVSDPCRGPYLTLYSMLFPGPNKLVKMEDSKLDVKVKHFVPAASETKDDSEQCESTISAQCS